jgi:CubicO group peptidase (beta-lactamase class C family)
VLGQIIERVSGKRYAEFLKETIFDPLKMQDTPERHLARTYRRVTAIVLSNSSNVDLVEITQDMVEIAKH